MRERIAPLAARLGAPLGVGFVLGLIGPFGTFDLLSTAPRVVYWLSIVSVNWLLADAIIRRVDALAGDRLTAPRLVVPLAGALAAAAPATGIVTLANGFSGIGWPENVVLLFGQVLVLLGAISLPVYAWEVLRESAEPSSDPAIMPAAGGGTLASEDQSAAHEAAAQARDGLAQFAARLPGPIKGRLLCLEMQDHYLMVHSTGGGEMVLCRMEDAARELENQGRRVHRSWWVARDAVDRVEREGQRVFLRLIDDRRVPVGRSFRPDLKAAGWL